MADLTNAERQRRFHAHRQGDHSLCLIANCSELAAENLPEVDGSEWGPDASMLWRELEGVVPAHYRPILREACRIVDRLDRLDGILARKNDWLRVNTMDFGENVKVKITMDGVLAESRQQAAVVQSLIKELAQFAPKAELKAEPKTGGLSDLSARIAARRNQTAG